MNVFQMPCELDLSNSLLRRRSISATSRGSSTMTIGFANEVRNTWCTGDPYSRDRLPIGRLYSVNLLYTDAMIERSPVIVSAASLLYGIPGIGRGYRNLLINPRSRIAEITPPTIKNNSMMWEVYLVFSLLCGESMIKGSFL